MILFIRKIAVRFYASLQFSPFNLSQSTSIAAFGHGFLEKSICVFISHQFRVSSDGLVICSVKAILIIILRNLISFPIYFNILHFVFLLLLLFSYACFFLCCCCLLFCGFHLTEVQYLSLYLCWRGPIHKRILSSNHVLWTYLFEYLLMYLFLLHDFFFFCENIQQYMEIFSRING